jgi:hypothetical protein
MILTSYLVMTDVLEPPWIQSTKRVDAQNHVVSFGPILTLFSLILSAVTSFKGKKGLYVDDVTHTFKYMLREVVTHGCLEAEGLPRLMKRISS